MRFLISLIILFAQSAFGIEIHEKGFSNISAGSGTHYSGRLMQWSIWEKTPFHAEFGLPFNYIAAATKESEKPNLSDEDFLGLKDQTDSAINLLIDYYYSRKESYPEVQVQAEAVFTSKIQVDLPSSMDLSSVSLNKFINSFIISDQPHVYTAVSSDWVKGFLPKFHSAKENISEFSKYFLVTINAGDSMYNCPMLNSGLTMNNDALVNSREAHIFMIVKIDEVESISQVRGIEEGASRVFVQKIVYSTSFIRSGKNIIAIYNNEPNSKLISQNAIVITDKVMSVPEILVNPLNLEPLKRIMTLVNIGSSDKEFILSSRNTDIIKSNSDQCGIGLGLGVASYTYNIARMMVESLSK